MTRGWRWVLVVLAAGVAGQFIAGAHSTELTVSEAIPPGLFLRDATGARIDLAHYRGHVLVLNFWATWCPACRAELADLSRFAIEEGPHCVDILGVTAEPAEVFTEFTQHVPLPYPVVQSAPGTEEGLGISVLPTTLILDGNGAIVRRIEGATTAEHLRAAASALHASPGNC